MKLEYATEDIFTEITDDIHTNRSMTAFIPKGTIRFIGNGYTGRIMSDTRWQPLPETFMMQLRDIISEQE